MMWLEIIELRSVGSNIEGLKSKLPEWIEELAMELGSERVRAFGRVLVDNDFSIHLLHKAQPVDIGGSSVGLRLAAALKEYGMISHSIWLELKEQTHDPKPEAKNGTR